MDINIEFSRLLLSSTLRDVQPLTTASERRAAWVYRLGRGSYEFHGPGNFYWHGDAHNAYEARARGWASWLAHRDAKIK